MTEPEIESPTCPICGHVHLPRGTICWFDDCHCDTAAYRWALAKEAEIAGLRTSKRETERMIRRMEEEYDPR